MARDIKSLHLTRPNFYAAEVAGSSNYSVTVEEYGFEDLNCACSCPDNRGGFCKHICVVLSQLIGDKNHTSNFSPQFVSSPQQFSAPQRTTYSNPQPTVSVPCGKAQLYDDLCQNADNYSQSSDGSLLAKISCLIYKNSKDAVAGAKYNPNKSIDTMQQIVSFCSRYSALLKQQIEQLNGCVELVARACSTVLLFVRDKDKISQLQRALGSAQWKSASANSWWKDVGEIAQRKTKANISSKDELL